MDAPVHNQPDQPVLRSTHDYGLDDPLENLQCISPQQAQILKSTFHAATIRDLVNLKFVRCLAAFITLEQQMENEKTREEEKILDDALQMTFPASDPTAIVSSISKLEDDKN
jgi:hypothetical protein